MSKPVRAGCSRQRHADVHPPARCVDFISRGTDGRNLSSGLSEPTGVGRGSAGLRRAPPVRFHSAGCRTTKANKKRRCLPVADGSEVHSSKGLYKSTLPLCQQAEAAHLATHPGRSPASSACFCRRPSSNERLSFIRGLDLIKVTVFGRRRQMSTAEIVSRHEAAGLSSFL